MNQKERRAAVAAELDMICKQNGGILKPPDVVEYARNKKTALHKEFCWDKNRNHEAYLLIQARRIISVAVTVHPALGTGKEIIAYVSLRDDRKKRGGGYRPLVVVMSDEERMGQLLVEARADLGAWATRYRNLKEWSEELSPVFDAIERLLPLDGAEESREQEALMPAAGG